jgi:hypothetical protein
VPSLIRLSPSTTVTIRRGTPSLRAMDVAASASVGATTAPSTNAAAHGRPGISAWATPATAKVVSTTSPTASSAIGRQALNSSRSEVKNAAP